MLKILLTGANGMVGKNIIDNHQSDRYIFFTPSSDELNLLNYSEINSYLAKKKPDLIIHAAGVVGGINANIKNPVKFLVNNMQMGLNLITAAKNNKIKNLLNLGSSCMYPKDIDSPLCEDMILKGELEPTNEGYALAKIACAKLCEYINRESSNYLYKTIIPCNIYGKFDKFDIDNSHMIPAVINKISNALDNNFEFIEVWGNGESRREFMYAEDLADFIFYAIKNFTEMPQNINVGLGYDYSINEYYRIVADIIGYNGMFVHDLSKPVGMHRKLTDTTLLSTFGWKHKTSLSTGIAKTYEYYLGEKK
ncbi:TPA: NAD-dependent epimerase/dehydratase family protein [Morganella morganii]